MRYSFGRRSGERRGRLERGHLHAEKLFLHHIWWALKGNFDHLHPEFEVLDWRGRSYFADFVYMSGDVKLLIEIKGFTSHVKDMDRKRYCNELNREVFLQAIVYRVISFAYDGYVLGCMAKVEEYVHMSIYGGIGNKLTALSF